MKKYLVLVLALVMAVFCTTACNKNADKDSAKDSAPESVKENVEDSAKDDAAQAAPEVKQGSVIDLGKSGLTVATAKKYVAGEITTKDTDENQVGYFKSDDSLVDFDVYEWAKASGETLESAAAEEAKKYENAEVKTSKISDLDVAYYNAVEENEGKKYDTVTYMIDNGDEFVEIVFWLDGDNAKAEADAIINSLAKKTKDDSAKECTLDKGCVALGKSGLSVTTEKKFVAGEITAEDTDENQVGYFKSDETQVDFDVYEWAKATDETLASAVAEEAKKYDNAEVKNSKINDFDVAYYNAVEENEGKKYDTVTYIVDNTTEFVEIVFWLDGDNAKAEADAIINTLAKIK